MNKAYEEYYRQQNKFRGIRPPYYSSSDFRVTISQDIIDKITIQKIRDMGTWFNYAEEYNNKEKITRPNELVVCLTKKCKSTDNTWCYIYDGKEQVSRSRTIMFHLVGYDFSEILSKIDMSQIDSFEFTNNESKTQEEYESNNPF